MKKRMLLNPVSSIHASQPLSTSASHSSVTNEKTPMKKNPTTQSGLFNPRALVTFTLCSVGAVLAMLSFAATAPSTTTTRLDANSPQAPTQAGWSKVGYPEAKTTPVLNGVTCTSASDCWVVGGGRGGVV